MRDLWYITKVPGEKMVMLFTHHFECEDCGLKFKVETTDEGFSAVLGTIDWRASCPNSKCKSENTTMYEVTEMKFK